MLRTRKTPKDPKAGQMYQNVEHEHHEHLSATDMRKTAATCNVKPESPHWSCDTFATMEELVAFSSHMVGKRPPNASKVLILKADSPG